MFEKKLTSLAGRGRYRIIYCYTDDVRMGSIDDGDPNTTNIYLGNLPTKVSLK